MTDPTLILDVQPQQQYRPARPRGSRLRIGLAMFGLVLTLGAVLAITMSPTPVDRGFEGAIDRVLAIAHRNGIPEWFGYNMLEFSANIVMFLPVGFLLALALPTRGWWVTLFAVPGFSVCIELAQRTFLDERFADPRDVVANSIGGFTGVIICFILRAIVHRRDEKVIARAMWDERYGDAR